MVSTLTEKKKKETNRQANKKNKWTLDLETRSKNRNEQHIKQINRERCNQIHYEFQIELIILNS